MDDDLLPAGALAMIGEITAGPATATITAKESQRYTHLEPSPNPL